MSKISAFHLLLVSALVVSHISLINSSAVNESEATNKSSNSSDAVTKPPPKTTTTTITTITTTTIMTTPNKSENRSSTTSISDIIKLSKPEAATDTTTNPATVNSTTSTATIIVGPTTSVPSTTTTTDISSSIEGISLSDLMQQSNVSKEEARKTINQKIDVNLRGQNRILVNKPPPAPQMVDFASDSIEAKVSDSTTQFGLNFLNNLSGNSKENVVISPLSLQNLLNMILLGSDDNSATQRELSKVLGYETTGLLSANNSSADRLKPHEAIKNVFQNILAATHLSVLSQVDDPDLLNANIGSLPINERQINKPLDPTLAALLQTSNREGDDPLTGQVNFTLANLVLTNNDFIDLKTEYEKDLKTYYSVNIEHFSNSPKNTSNKLEPVHERVNKWVKNITQNQIEQLVTGDDLSGPDLMMVLLNAAHFKGRWLHTFNIKATSDRAFINNGEEENSSQVKFMRQKESFGYADFTTKQFESAPNIYSLDSDTQLTQDSLIKPVDEVLMKESSSASSLSPQIELSKEELRRLELSKKLNCTVLSMPFSLNEGQELSMVILLPAINDGFEELQKALDAQTLNEIYRSLNHQEVRVEMPKFSFETSYDAKSTLSNMGLNNTFDAPNFDRMLTLKVGNNPRVDKIIHKAKISVDESGAEAAAASMASIVLRNFIRQPAPLFVADHPFLFIIRHSRSNMPLFMGRVSQL